MSFDESLKFEIAIITNTNIAYFLHQTSNVNVDHKVIIKKYIRVMFKNITLSDSNCKDYSNILLQSNSTQSIIIKLSI